MKNLLGILSLVLFSVSASADQLKYVLESQAKKAVAYLEKMPVKEVVLWCGCCDKDSKKPAGFTGVAYRKSTVASKSGKSYEVVLKGLTEDGKEIEIVVDLANVWVPVGDTAHCLAHELGFEVRSCTENFLFPKKPVANQGQQEKIYSYVEWMPEPSVNIRDFVNEYMVYPEEAKKQGIEGRVILKFVINEDGSVSDIEPKTNRGGGLEEEAIRLVKLMPKWQPGKQNGKAVKVSYMLPIFFRLNGSDK